MSFFLNAYARSFQAMMWVASHFLSFKEPKVISGEGTMSKIPSLLKEKGKKNALIVTDSGLYQLGLYKHLIESFEKEGFAYAFYHEVVANPTVDNVEAGFRLFQKQKCDCLVALGGGSAMDCCKAIGARAVRPRKKVNQLRGQLHVRRRPPFMVAIPTTAGTGSETTVAAVIVDKQKGDKYAINDPVLIPRVAVLDPTLLVGLPARISSTTGMDALTHAIEAYIGHSNTRKTKRYAIDATKLIFEYLEKSVEEPTNLEYREKMQLASYKAGVAFTRAYVGIVHAIAHSLGGKYNVPHGLANAIILPVVLKAFGKSAEKKLAQLAVQVGLKGESNHELAQKFISSIEDMNKRMDITNTFSNLIDENDIPFLVNHAYKEGVPLYPTPKILSKQELTEIYHILQNRGK